MKIWGINKEYPTLSWWVNFMGGHVNMGPVTIFGANAMNWVVQIRTKRWGVICFTLPVLARWEYERHYGEGKKVYRWYFYISANGTPWGSTFYRGSDKQEVIRAQIRKLNFGHGFNPNKFRNELYALNQKFDSMYIREYDVHKWGHPVVKDTLNYFKPGNTA